MSNNALGGLLAASIGVIIVVAILIIAAYILWALAVQKVLKKLGSDMAWMAWIPILSTIALAREADDGTGNVDVFGMSVPVNLFMFWGIAKSVLSMVPTAGGILSFAFGGICGGVMYRTIYAKMEGRKESEMLGIGLVSGFFPIVALVKFFSYK